MAEPRKRAAKKVVVPDAVIPAPKKATAPTTVKVRRGAAQLSAERAVALRQGALVARDGERLGTGSTTTLYTPWWLAEFDSGVGGVAPILSIGTAVANASVAAVQAAFAVAYAGQSLPLVSQSNGPPTSGTVSIPQVAAMIGAQATADAAAYGSLIPQRSMPKISALPTLMSSPPAIAFVGVGSPSSGISSHQFLNATKAIFPTSTPSGFTSNFTYYGGIPVATATYYALPTQPSSSHSVTYSVVGDFYGTTLEYMYFGQGNLSSRVWVDGQYAETPYIADTTQDGAYHMRSITFPTATWRRIRIDLNSGFWGINIGPTDTWIPAPPAANRLLVIGDSYGEGTGSTAIFDSYPHLLGRYLGFDDVCSYSDGGTGLLANNSGSGLTYRQRSADWAALNATAVCVQLSINDDSSSTSALNAELALLLPIIQALPTVKSVWVQGTPARGGGDASNKQTRDAAMAAVCPVPFVSLVNGPGAPLWTGTGNVESPSGSGNSDIVYHGSGGLSGHPSQAGHEMIARAGAVGYIASRSAA